MPFSFTIVTVVLRGLFQLHKGFPFALVLPGSKHDRNMAGWMKYRFVGWVDVDVILIYLVNCVD